MEEVRSFSVDMTVTIEEDQIREDIGKDFASITNEELRGYILSKMDEVDLQIDSLIIS